MDRAARPWFSFGGHIRRTSEGVRILIDAMKMLPEAARPGLEAYYSTERE